MPVDDEEENSMHSSTMDSMESVSQVGAAFDGKRCSNKYVFWRRDQPVCERRVCTRDGQERR